MIRELTMHDMVPETGLPPDNNMHVVMFYGQNCGPCKATMPYYEAVSKFFTEKNAPINFHRIHAWEPGEQTEYCKNVWNVNGVPHFKVFYQGQIVSIREGGGDEPAMNKFVLDCIDEVFKRFGARL